MNFVELLSGMSPLPQFIVVIALVTLFFTTINYLMSRITIIVRGYPPPHCYDEVECMEMGEEV